MGIFITGFVSYGLALTFYGAIFPILAHNTTRLRELRQRYDQGEISEDVYEEGEIFEKNKISSLSVVRTLTSSCQAFRVMACVDRSLPLSVAP